jgi:2-(1,2-epoxy-1,2-dihydrophenyl)acetyl-CoA isomerase
MSPSGPEPLPGEEAEGLARRLEDGVLWLVLDRPDAANTFTKAVQRCLGTTFLGINERRDVRAVVITAAGDRHFCGGPYLADPDFRPRQDRAAGDAGRTLREGSQRVIGAMLDCEKPILCGLNGTAVGGGANLALASDLIIAVEGARMIELFTRRALIPDGGAAYLLSRHLPRNLVKELILFGDELSTDEGARLGLYNRVVPREEFTPLLEEWARRLAAGPTRSFAASKQLLNDAPDASRASAFALEAVLVEQIAATDDVAEGVAAFMDKREPRFHGR